MNFIEAVKLMVEEDKKDIRVYLASKRWEKKYTNPYKIYINDKRQLVKLHLNENPMSCNYGEYEEDIYSASPKDILADDWEMVKTESIERLYNFQEALKALKKGKSIRRQKHRGNVYIGNDPKFTIEDIEAEDWIIEK